MGEDHASCIMILNDLVVALTPGPAGVLELRQPLSIRWHRESPTRGHENEGSDQTRGNQILKGKGFCFSTFLKRFNIMPPPVGCFQGREPHLGHKDHRWPASHLAWTSGYQNFHQKLGYYNFKPLSHLFLPPSESPEHLACHGKEAKGGRPWGDVDHVDAQHQLVLLPCLQVDFYTLSYFLLPVLYLYCVDWWFLNIDLCH